MSTIINPRVDTFHGLNNALNPASAEYDEGMAYVSDNSRLNEAGLWAKGPALTNALGEPSVLSDPIAGGTHFKEMFIKGLQKIVQAIGNTVTIDVGPNEYAYFVESTVVKWWDGSSEGTAGEARPAAVVSVATTGNVGRQLKGTYYYIATKWNSNQLAESLPSQVKAYTAAADSDAVTITVSGGSSNYKIYRSLRTSAADGVFNPPNEFYYLGTISGSTLVDYFNDEEIRNYPYEGRGSAPPANVDYLAAWRNRMYYFVGNIVWWSSAGRPEEVAQEYELEYDDTYSTKIPMKPRLSVGVYGEAKYEISELAGQTVLATSAEGDKLWVFTAATIGFLYPATGAEGVKYREVRKGVGVVSQWTLAKSPYGLFGADRRGIWLKDNQNNIRRLSDGIIDIDDDDKSTYCAEAYKAASFGVWVPNLQEYWWSVNNVQIVYQANRGIFVGPYNHTLSGGCTFTNSSGFQCYLTGGKTVHKTNTTGIQLLKLWFGGSSIVMVKENIQIEVLYSEISNGNVTITAYVGNTASEGDCIATGNLSHVAGKNVGKISPNSSGRLFELKFSIGSSVIAPIAAIMYRANIVPWGEKKLR